MKTAINARIAIQLVRLVQDQIIISVSRVLRILSYI